MAAYYNEIEPFAAQWLRNLISAGHIPAGDVDERSITEVQPDDLRGYTQAHFFAGLGGWPYAARLAGLADERPIWTGSPPCQPHTRANPNRLGLADERHLWPELARLVRACRPPVLFGEQSADAIANGWLDEVASDLEREGYAVWAKGIPACAVGAEHERLRLWFVADAGEPGLSLSEREALLRARRRQEGAAASRSDGWAAQSGLVLGVYGISDGLGRVQASGDKIKECRQEEGAIPHPDHDCVCSVREDGKPISAPQGPQHGQQRAQESRSALPGMSCGGAHEGRNLGEREDAPCRVHSVRGVLSAEDQSWPSHNLFGPVFEGIGPARSAEEVARRGIVPALARGVPGRVGGIKAAGNAIVPQVGAEVIAAYMECLP